jgi:hypothetical protein
MLDALDRGETLHFLKALHPGQSCHPVQWQLRVGQCVSCVILAVVVRIIRSAVVVVRIIRSAVVVIRIIRSSAVVVSSAPSSCKLGGPPRNYKVYRLIISQAFFRNFANCLGMFCICIENVQSRNCCNPASFFLEIHYGKCKLLLCLRFRFHRLHTAGWRNQFSKSIHGLLKRLQIWALVCNLHKETRSLQAIKLLFKVARKIQLHQPNSPRCVAADVHRISLKNFNNLLI